jgi:predicted dehydrogenase
MLKLGVVGVGGIASMHIDNILKGACQGIEIVALADRKQPRRDWGKEKVPSAVIFSEGRDLIQSGLCEAVLISVPHYQHPELTILALQNNLHVLCEKPAGVYTLQVREMIAEADKHPELTFAMMFNQRTNCVYRKIREMVETKAIGELKRINWIVTDWYRTQFYYDSGDWRATWAGEGGGVLLNQDPHQLDLLQWMFGMPVKIRAFCHEAKWHDIEVEDDVTAYMEFENGATGVFVTSTGDAPGTNRLEVTGTLGKLICDYTGVTFYRLESDERQWCKTAQIGYAIPKVTEEKVETDGINPQHVGVMNAFAKHIAEKSPLVADGREGINGLMISNAMYLSSWTDETVTLPIDEHRFLELLNKKRASSKHKEDKGITMSTQGSFGSTSQWTRKPDSES